jgi:hypothetical protein
LNLEFVVGDFSDALGEIFAAAIKKSRRFILLPLYVFADTAQRTTI